jgi:hypothetical protein
MKNVFTRKERIKTPQTPGKLNASLENQILLFRFNNIRLIVKQFLTWNRNSIFFT